MGTQSHGKDDIFHQIKTVIEIIEQPIKQKNQRENREEKEKYFFAFFIDYPLLSVDSEINPIPIIAKYK